MNRVPAGRADLVAATAPGAAPVGRSWHQKRHAAADSDVAFDDSFPTQPIAVGRHQVGLVLDGRHTRAPDATSRRMSSAYRQPPPSWHHHAASPGGVSRRAPARTAVRPAHSTITVALAVAVAAIIGSVGYLSWAAWSPSAAPDAPARSAPATEARQESDVPPRPPPPGSGGRDHDRGGALGAADGAVPDGLTVFDDDIPAVAKLDPSLLEALRRAATDAADDRVEFIVNSGWRSPEYQEQLLDEAISKYGSKKEAARWVATADTSPHVSGDAVDIGPTGAAAWLSKHGAEYGLCQIYRNEPWHFELRPDAVDGGCPRMYADPTQDPRMQK
jgi:zinc D-Ala-D-Ala carboxypeptidase